MKNLKLLLVLPALLVLQTVFGQANDHLQLSDSYPKANEKITVTYNPAGTPLYGKSDLNAVVYFMDNKDYPVADLDLKPNGKLLKGDFTVPAAAKAFFVKISKDDDIDDNNGQGYLYMVYQNKKPVAGAYASKAYVLFSGIGRDFAKIKIDPNEAASLYKQEFETYPQSEKEYQSNYYSLLASGKSPDFATILDQKLNNLLKSNDEKDLIIASSLLKRRRKTVQADSLTTIIKARYPNGEFVRNELGVAIITEKDLVKKEALYNEYGKKYPESQSDYRVFLAIAYLQQGKLNDYQRFENQIKDKRLE